MSLQHSSNTKRIQLFFTAEGLPARDELLLKSMIRLLNFKTKHDWQYKPEHANILIVKQANNAGEHDLLKNKLTRSCRTISLDTLQFDATIHGLTGRIDTWRLNAVKVEEALNRLGDDWCQQSHVVQSPPSSAANQADRAESYRLTRWPLASMLQNASRRRMAAVLVGSPVTLANVVEKTGVESGECADYIVELMQAGLLTTTLADTPMAVELADPIVSATTFLITSNTAAKRPPSIFARIRNRLSTFVIKSP